MPPPPPHAPVGAGACWPPRASIAVGASVPCSVPCPPCPATPTAAAAAHAFLCSAADPPALRPPPQPRPRRRRRKHSRPRGKVRRAGKRARSDPAHDAYVVGCVLEDLMRSVEEVDQLLPHRACELSSPPMHSGGRTRASVSHCWSWPRGPRRSSLTRPAPDQQCACVRCTREEVVAGHAPARAMSADCEPRKEY